MLFLFKYRFLQMIREFSVMFWALAFPMILGTFYYFSFGTNIEATGESEWDAVPVAVVEEDVHSENAQSFDAFLKEMDGDILDIRDVTSEKDALDELNEENISGIYYVKDTPSLTVGKNGLDESILTSLLATYNQNASLMRKIASDHPERLADAAASLDGYQDMVEERSLGGKSLNPNIQYFYALIAYACLSGMFLGVRASFDSQANLSALGARRSITPTHRLLLVIVDMLTLALIHFINILILNLYVVKALGISLGDSPGALLLVDLMGSVIGVAMGLAFGSIGKAGLGVKMGIVVALTLIPGFLAGLMFGNMKNILELKCPIINRINPAAVLSDAFYCMGVYNDMARFTRCLLTLGAMSVLFVALAFLGVRRKCYDNI